MISYAKGSIWGKDFAVFIIPCDCVYAQFRQSGTIISLKKKQPKIFKQYKSDCLKNAITLGGLNTYYDDYSVPYLFIPLQDHWKSPSNIIIVQSCLVKLLEYFKTSNYQRRVGFPAIRDIGLNWCEIKSYVELLLAKVTDDIVICE